MEVNTPYFLKNIDGQTDIFVKSFELTISTILYHCLNLEAVEKVWNWSPKAVLVVRDDQLFFQRLAKGSWNMTPEEFQSLREVLMSLREACLPGALREINFRTGLELEVVVYLVPDFEVAANLLSNRGSRVDEKTVLEAAP